jgi:hypothetical protein
MRRTSDDGWKKDGVAVEHGVDTKLPSCEKPDFPVLCCENRILLIKLLMVTRLAAQSSDQKLSLVFLEKPSALRIVCEEKPERSAPENGWNA